MDECVCASLRVFSLCFGGILFFLHGEGVSVNFGRNNHQECSRSLIAL